MAKQQDREEVLERRLKVLLRILGRWDYGIEEVRLAEQCDSHFVRDISWLIKRRVIDRAAPELGPEGGLKTPARLYPSMILKRAVAGGS